MSEFLVTRAEFEKAVTELVANIDDTMTAFNALKNALNVQADVLGMHRFILEKFVPMPLLEQGVKEYRAARLQAIAEEQAKVNNKSLESN